jgi:hypothetical protein
METNPYQSDLDVEEYYQAAVKTLDGPKIDMYHQLSRDGVRDIDFDYIQTGFEGLQYRRFIRIIFCRNSCDSLLLKIAGNFAALNPVERQAAKAILKEYDHYALDRNFWRADCGKVLKEVCRSYDEMLTAKDCRIENKVKFIVFNLLSDNLAVIALHDKELRKVAGIRKGLYYWWRKFSGFRSPRPENKQSLSVSDRT